MGVFKSKFVVRFHDGDPGGVAFFGNIYRHAHDAFEDFLRHAGFTYDFWFRNSEWGVPLRKSECVYHRPLRPGHAYDIEVALLKIGDSSLTFQHKVLESGSDKVCAEVTLVHSFYSIQQKGKMAIPPSIRTKLLPFLQEPS